MGVVARRELENKMHSFESVKSFSSEAQRTT